MKNPGRSGMTLVEVAVAMALTALIALGVLSASGTFFKAERTVQDEMDFDSMSLGVGFFLQSSLSCSSLLPQGLQVPADPAAELSLRPTAETPQDSRDTVNLKSKVESLTLHGFTPTRNPHEYLASLRLVARVQPSGALRSKDFPVYLRTVPGSPGDEIVECGSGASGTGVRRLSCGRDQVIQGISDSYSVECRGAPHPVPALRQGCPFGSMIVGVDAQGEIQCMPQPRAETKETSRVHCKLYSDGTCTLACGNDDVHFVDSHGTFVDPEISYSYENASQLLVTMRNAKPSHIKDPNGREIRDQIEFTGLCVSAPMQGR